MKITLTYKQNGKEYEKTVTPTKDDYLRYLWEAYGHDTADRGIESDSHKELVASAGDNDVNSFISGYRFGLNHIIAKLIDNFDCICEWLDFDDGFRDYLKDVYCY